MAETNTSDFGSTLNDVLSDVSDSTKAKVANAEQEMLLQYTLGLDLRDVSLNNATPDAADIAAKVVQSIVGRIDQNRTRIDENVLRGVLSTNITDALRSIVPHTNDTKNNTDQIGMRRIRAIAEGVYASLPKNLVDELMRYSMPVALQVKKNLNRHKLYLDKVTVNNKGQLDSTGDPVVIDTRAKFWIENSFSDRDELAKALTGKKFTYCGIETSTAGSMPSAEIDKKLADAIADEKMDVIRLSHKYQTRLETIRIGSHDVQCSIDLNALVSTETPPPHRPHRYVGEFDLAELTSYLRTEENLRHFVHGLGSISLNQQATYGGIPLMRLPEFFANLIFTRIKGHTAGTLATEQASLYEIQRELHEQHQYHTRLREGSDNSAGAALAASILMRYKDIGDVLLSGDSQAKEKLEKINLKINLESQISRVNQATLSTTRSWNENELDITACSAAMPLCTTGAAINFTIGGQTLGPIATATKDQAANALQWVRDREKMAREQIAEYQKIESALRAVATAVAQLKDTNVTPPNILDLFTISPKPYVVSAPNKANFTRDNINQFIAEMGNDTDLTISDVEKEEKTKLEQEVKDSKNGKRTGLHGADAQHAVIAKYFENYHGCTAEEAKQAANCILARTKIDADVSAEMSNISDELYEDDRSRLEVFKSNVKTLFKHGSFSAGAHARHVTAEVCNACKVPIVDKTPRWAGANYQQLVTAYFTLKKLYNDKSVPKHLQITKTTFVQNQMREITKHLMQKHAVQLMKEFGPANGISDEKINAALKDPKKKELLTLMEQFLNGEPPKNYEKRINDAMKHAEKHVESGRRTLKWGTVTPAVKTAKLVGKGVKKGATVVGKGVVGSAKLTGKGVKGVALAPVAATKGIWNNKGAIATIAGLSLLGGPIAGVGAWYLHKQFSGDSSKTA